MRQTLIQGSLAELSLINWKKQRGLPALAVEMDAQMVKSFGRKECDAKCSKRFIESNKTL